jgi:hypothetical protein
MLSSVALLHNSLSSHTQLRRDGSEGKERETETERERERERNLPKRLGEEKESLALRPRSFLSIGDYLKIPQLFVQILLWNPRAIKWLASHPP